MESIPTKSPGRVGEPEKGGAHLRVYRRLLVSIGSIVALLLAGGATWKVS